MKKSTEEITALMTRLQEVSKRNEAMKNKLATISASGYIKSRFDIIFEIESCRQELDTIYKKLIPLILEKEETRKNN